MPEVAFVFRDVRALFQGFLIPVSGVLPPVYVGYFKLRVTSVKKDKEKMSSSFCFLICKFLRSLLDPFN